MPDFSLQQLLMRLAAALIIVAVHGYLLTLFTRLFGDEGPRHDGRLTLNPFTHLDLLGGAGILMFSLGWIRPIAIDPEELRNPRRDLVLIVVLSLIGTLIVAGLLHVARPFLFTVLPDTFAFGAVTLINTTVSLSVWFVAINVIPVFPLTAGYLLQIVPQLDGPLLARYELWLKLALGALIVTGFARLLLAPIYSTLLGLIAGS